MHNTCLLTHPKNLNTRKNSDLSEKPKTNNFTTTNKVKRKLETASADRKKSKSILKSNLKTKQYSENVKIYHNKLNKKQNLKKNLPIENNSLGKNHNHHAILNIEKYLLCVQAKSMKNNQMRNVKIGLDSMSTTNYAKRELLDEIKTKHTIVNGFSKHPVLINEAGVVTIKLNQDSNTAPIKIQCNKLENVEAVKDIDILLGAKTMASLGYLNEKVSLVNTPTKSLPQLINKSSAEHQATTLLSKVLSMATKSVEVPKERVNNPVETKQFSQGDIVIAQSIKHGLLCHKGEIQFITNTNEYNVMFPGKNGSIRRFNLPAESLTLHSKFQKQEEGATHP